MKKWWSIPLMLALAFSALHSCLNVTHIMVSMQEINNIVGY